MTDPPSRQRGRSKKNKDHSSQYIGLKIWSWVPEGARHQDRLADWPSAITRLWLCLAHSSLMMEAVGTSETSVDNNFTRQYEYIPEDNSEHHTRRRENLKSHMFSVLFCYCIFVFALYFNAVQTRLCIRVEVYIGMTFIFLINFLIPPCRAMHLCTSFK
jgi:hypothetical protein